MTAHGSSATGCAGSLSTCEHNQPALWKMTVNGPKAEIDTLYGVMSMVFHDNGRVYLHTGSLDYDRPQHFSYPVSKDGTITKEYRGSGTVHGLGDKPCDFEHSNGKPCPIVGFHGHGLYFTGAPPTYAAKMSIALENGLRRYLAAHPEVLTFAELHHLRQAHDKVAQRIKQLSTDLKNAASEAREIDQRISAIMDTA